ncbi:MAG: NAD(P)/FAD-dependent oxidoreductase [Clostridiales bacterium]|nr:NAD(P)/FAD-dependent oxidoreductase [Clostridiales bacterium]
MFDVIIIGRGPAGCQAAIYTLRANLKTLVIGKDSLLAKANLVENYYGITKISGKELLDEGERQVKKFGGLIISDEVLDIKVEDGVKKVLTSNDEYQAKTVLIATGNKKIPLAIENLKRFEGSGISYCTVCDGFFFKGLKVGVLGYNDYAVHEAMELATFTSDITVYTNGREFNVSDKYKDMARGFKVNNKAIKKFDGVNELNEICFDDGTRDTVDGVFVAYGNADYNALAKKLGLIENNNFIVTNERQETNVSGIFAAGDCTGVFKQIAVAVGQGAIAGDSIVKYVKRIC